uniref:Fucose isomerase n=1 Tax=Staphylothermus marinus TaxID=2280 RepID=A0A7C4H9S4_STAMA
MKISIVVFANKLHSENYVVEQYKRISESIAGLDVDLLWIDKGDEEIPKADVYIAPLITGGTSRLAYRVLSPLGKPVIIVAKGEHNSLASALSLRSRLESSGLKTTLLPLEDNDDFGSRIRDIIDALRATVAFRNLRILEINEDGSLSDDAKLYLRIFGGSINSVSIDDIEKIIADFDEKTLESFVREIGSFIDFGEKKLEVFEPARLALALEHYVRVRNYDVLLIDCFPMIMKLGYTPCLAVSILNSRGKIAVCESDYYSLPLMFLSKALTGFEGWVANPSGYNRDGIIRLAHCTMAYSIGRNCKLIDHFETGKACGVSCRYLFGEVAIMRFNRDFSKLKVYRGEVIASGFLNEGYCRTQLHVKLRGVKPEDFYLETYGNHHVVAPLVRGFLEKLRIVSWWFGWSLEVIS